MFVHYRTLGFILKKEDRGEADRIFTIFTKDFGKIKVLGKAIRKIKSKLKFGMEPFYLSKVEFIQGKTGKTLTDVVLVNKFGKIRKDLDKLKIAYMIMEAVDNLIRGEETDHRVWDHIIDTFEKLNSLELHTLFYHYFLWNLFSLLGYEPFLSRCVNCQKSLDPNNLYFDVGMGGIVCGRCCKEKDKKINPDIVKILRVLIDKKWGFISRLKVSKEQRRELEKLSDKYLSSL